MSGAGEVGGMSEPVRLDRRVLRVSGPDACAFLQNLLTQDIEHLEKGDIAYGALLSPQGKVISDLLVHVADAPVYLLDVDASRADRLAQLLTRYRLRAQVSIAARPAEKSGSWQANGAFFQIYDLNITDSGTKAVIGGELSFTLPSGTTIFQWWEMMSRQDSAADFDISFNYGPLQVGATQGAGFVGKSASASQELPAVSIGSLRCA